MGERITGPARDTVRRAQDGARDLGQAFIGGEHLLLGLVGDGVEDTAATVLRRHGVTADLVRGEIRRWTGADRWDEDDAGALQAIGIDLDAVRAVVEDAFGPGALDEPVPPEPRGPRSVFGRREPRPIKGHLPLTRNAGKVIELAVREAVRQHRTVEGAHILLGMLRSRAGAEIGILTRAGVEPDALRVELLAALAEAA